jgi:ADP-heptose:LPS heptosyltransferase
VAALDLVIAVDTAVAHLAVAMGKLVCGNRISAIGAA